MKNQNFKKYRKKIKKKKREKKIETPKKWY